ncbi:uncharacterized protein F4822DRAFT_441898 [Hypoxylon trugodes]|uniref:uncharacterized protein n=1 Tax=Hypoxylon trugodes TaxID=326681 RepID=UPI00219C80E5|nr:uncharacterized protein F4822DRAFT_441898 [Hypoxylon trugodes]KAI1390543.1 hypothetical protein F4822DRAFT_441898 [Hypoxylon trugodes]
MWKLDRASFNCITRFSQQGQADNNTQGQSRRKGETSLPTPSASVHSEDSVVIVRSIEAPSGEFSSLLASQTPVPRPTEVVTREVHRAASAPPLQLREDIINPTGKSGFLGETSHVSIFADGLGSFCVSPSDLECSHVQKVRLSHDRIAQGCKVLSFLKDKHILNRFISRWYEICEDDGCICIEPIMKEWLWGFSHFGDVLRDQNPEKIQRLCELLWRNTQTSITFDENTTAQQWARSGTGPNLRWEVIGLVAAIAGQSASTPEPSDRFSKNHDMAHSSFPRQMNEISEACLSFCRECETVDDLFAWLLMENYCLSAKLKGDTSHVTYTQCGEVTAAAVAMGLHQGIKPEDKIPFFLVEMRKKFFAQTYSAEIGTATFLGRPPRISHRYCNLQPPLDLTSSQIVLSGDDLAIALAGLDERGFNTTGRIRRVTWIKTWLGFAPQREDILDLAIGRYSRDEILQRAEDIQKRSQQHIEGLPSFIKKMRDGPMETEGRTPMEMLYTIVIRQAFRANDLLLQRVLIRKAGASSEKLIHTARLILKDILLMSQRHDLGTLFQTDVASLLAVQGMRSAAVIAVELLKQEQLPVYPKEPLLPRSQTIQDLAVFAARLEAISPTDGSYSICDQGRKVITYILDKILNHQYLPDRFQISQELLARPESRQSDPSSSDVPLIEPSHPYGLYVPGTMDSTMADLSFGMESPFLGPDNDFMQWLENMDWERPVQ